MQLESIEKASHNAFLPQLQIVDCRWSHLLNSLDVPVTEQPQMTHRLQPVEPAVCTICGSVFQKRALVRFHITRVHEQRTAEELLTHEQQMRAGTFEHVQHSIVGMPECRHCGHKLRAWAAFMSHHSRQCCPVLHQGAVKPSHRTGATGTGRCPAYSQP